MPFALIASFFGGLLGLLMALLSVFLILLILVQRGRGGGLTGALGGPGGQSAFGSKAGDTFTRITFVVAGIWIFLCAFTMFTLGDARNVVVPQTKSVLRNAPTAPESKPKMATDESAGSSTEDLLNSLSQPGGVLSPDSAAGEDDTPEEAGSSNSESADDSKSEESELDTPANQVDSPTSGATTEEAEADSPTAVEETQGSVGDTANADGSF